MALYLSCLTIDSLNSKTRKTGSGAGLCTLHTLTCDTHLLLSHTSTFRSCLLCLCMLALRLTAAPTFCSPHLHIQKLPSMPVYASTLTPACSLLRFCSLLSQFCPGPRSDESWCGILWVACHIPYIFVEFHNDLLCAETLGFPENMPTVLVTSVQNGGQSCELSC